MSDKEKELLAALAEVTKLAAQNGVDPWSMSRAVALLASAEIPEQEPADPVNRLLAMKAEAYDVWQDKTDWVQDSFSEQGLPVRYLGMHRADVMRLEIERLRKANEGQTRLNVTLVIENKELIAERDQLRAEVAALRSTAG